MRLSKTWIWIILAAGCGVATAQHAWAQTEEEQDREREQPSWSETEFLPGIKWPEPEVVTPGEGNTAPPSDAIVLFGGKDLSAWKGGDKWKVEDGVAIIGRGQIETKQPFGDCQLHVEWSAPEEPTGDSQGRGNSGIFLMGLYEVQVLDSYDNKTYSDGQAGAIYKQMPPLVNAMRPPGEWNYYDIAFTAPRFKEDGSVESPAMVTVFHNGVLVQNHFELAGGTSWFERAHYDVHEEKLPIMIQDHGNPVRFRNIWVREIEPIVGKQTEKPKFRDHRTGKEWLETEGDYKHPPKS